MRCNPFRTSCPKRKTRTCAKSSGSCTTATGKAALYGKENGVELKEPNPMKKAMMWGSIKMSTLKDNSRAHIAEMMTQGTVMGITALTRSIHENTEQDERVKELAEELLHLEQDYEKKLKAYL